MLRKLAPSFVVTVAALSAGCRTTDPPTNPPAPTTATATESPLTPSADLPTSNPPAPITRKRKRTTDAGRTYERVDSPIPFDDLEPLNPTDPGGRTIYAGTDGTCFTQQPMSIRPKGYPPGVPAVVSTAVDCPPSMDDPAWDTCSERISRAKTKGGCYCFPTGGNPPPPPTKNACPRK